MKKKNEKKTFFYCCLLVAIGIFGGISVNAQDMFSEKVTIVSKAATFGELILAEPTGIPEIDAKEIRNVFITSEGLMLEVDGKLEPYIQSLPQEAADLIEVMKGNSQ